MYLKKLSIPLLALSLSQTTFATFGDNLAGIGPVSRGMAGNGISMDLGHESAIINPAFLSTEKNFELGFGATHFSPDVSVKNENANLIGGTTADVTSEADSFLIPSIGLIYKLTEDLNFGIGAYGVSGLGVDYRDSKATNGVFGFGTSLTLMQFSPNISYKFGNFRFAVGTPLTYGNLGITYYSSTNTSFISPGNSSDLAASWQTGFGYEWKNLSIGAIYKSKINLEYDLQLSEPAADFNAQNVITSNKLSQPAEYGVGFSYTLKNLTMAFDYKVIDWEGAEGYKSFGWESQDVISLAFKYQLMKKTTLRAGYSQADSPLGDKALKNARVTTAGNDTSALNIFNLIGFPAIITKHYSVGAGHKFSERFNIDFSYVYAPEEEDSAVYNAGTGNMTYKTKHSQSSISIGANWRY